MGLVIIIDLIAVIGIVALAQSKGGLERALPFASFLVALVPIESVVPLPIFALTTHRIVVATLLLLYLARGGGSTGEDRKLSTPLKALLLINVGWCVVSVANSIVPVMSIKKLLSIVLDYYGLYFVYWKTVSSTATVHKIFIAIVLAIGLCSVWGIAETYQGVDALEYFPALSHHFDMDIEMDREVRIRATYDHPILYGAVLAMTITLTLYLLTVVTSAPHRLLLWLGLMLMFFNIYKTSSRGPWLVVILGCIVLFLFGRKRLRRPILCVAVLAVAVLIIRPGVWGTIRGLFENTFNEDTSTGTSYSYRPALRKAAVNYLLDKPSMRTAWGYGQESFYDVHLTGLFLGQPHVFLSCDDAWVELLIETGFVGLAIMMAVLFKPAWVAWRQYWQSKKPDGDLPLVLFVNMFMFYVQMSSVGMYSWGQNGYLLWILIACTFALSKRGDVQAGQLSGTPTARKAESEERCGLPEWWEPVGQTSGIWT